MAQNKALYPFVSKLFSLVSDPSNGQFVSWTDAGDQFTVWNPSEFSTNVLPRYFKHNNFCSFIRQLNIYGFHKIDTENWIFKHEDNYFQRGNSDLLGKITRRKQQKRASPNSDEASTKTMKSSGESLPSTPMTPPSPLHAGSPISPASYSPLDTSSNGDRTLADEVSYLKSVNEYVMTEMNGLKRKTLTHDNTISWLIQELLKSKKDMEEMKRQVKKLSTDADDEKRRQVLEMVGLSGNSPSPLVAGPSSSLLQQHQQQQQLLQQQQLYFQQQQQKLQQQQLLLQQQMQQHNTKSDIEEVYNQQLHNLLSDDMITATETPFPTFQGQPGFNPAAQDPSLKSSSQAVTEGFEASFDSFMYDMSASQPIYK